MRLRLACVSCLGLFLLAGCAGKAPPPSGFISSYDSLQKADDGALRYVSPELKNYTAFIIDPVALQAQKEPPKLSAKEQAEVAQYFHDTLSKTLTQRGFRIASKPDVGVARVRIALTNIQESKWYLNLHPASKLSGAGTGGASMEGEVIDAVTGKQLGAVIQAGRGGQFELDTFKKLDDVKDAINKWAEAAGKRLDDLRGIKTG